MAASTDVELLVNKKTPSFIAETFFIGKTRIFQEQFNISMEVWVYNRAIKLFCYNAAINHKLYISID